MSFEPRRWEQDELSCVQFYIECTSIISAKSLGDKTEFTVNTKQAV
jgi:hypothetical protein